MRISDWSSDVCSSDLPCHCGAVRRDPRRDARQRAQHLFDILDPAQAATALAHPSPGAVERDVVPRPRPPERSEERRVGQSVSVRVDLGGRRIIKKKTDREYNTHKITTETTNT